MIDEELAELLKNDREAFNKWRKEHPAILLNFGFMDFKDAYLRKANLEGATSCCLPRVMAVTR